MSDFDSEEENGKGDHRWNRDFIVLHGDLEEERELAALIVERLEQIEDDDGTFAVADTYENVALLGNQEVDDIDCVVENAIFILFFRTKAFFRDDMREFAVNVALDNAIRDRRKSRSWSLIPLDIGSDGKRTKIKGRHCINSLTGLSVSENGEFKTERLRRYWLKKKREKEKEQNDRDSTRKKQHAQDQNNEQQQDTSRQNSMISDEENHGDTFIKTVEAEETHLQIVNPSIASSEGGNFVTVSSPDRGPYPESSDDASMSSENASMSRSSSCMSAAESHCLDTTPPLYIPVVRQNDASELEQTLGDLSLSDFEENAYGSGPTTVASLNLGLDERDQESVMDDVIQSRRSNCEGNNVLSSRHLARPSSLSTYSLVVDNSIVNSTQHVRNNASSNERDQARSMPLNERAEENHSQESLQRQFNLSQQRQIHQLQQPPEDALQHQYQEPIQDQQQLPQPRSWQQQQVQGQQGEQHQEQPLAQQVNIDNDFNNIAFPEVPLRDRDPREYDLHGQGDFWAAGALGHDDNPFPSATDSGKGSTLNPDTEPRL